MCCLTKFSPWSTNILAPCSWLLPGWREGPPPVSTRRDLPSRWPICDIGFAWNPTWSDRKPRCQTQCRSLLKNSKKAVTVRSPLAYCETPGQIVQQDQVPDTMMLDSTRHLPHRNAKCSSLFQRNVLTGVSPSSYKDCAPLHWRDQGGRNFGKICILAVSLAQLTWRRRVSHCADVLKGIYTKSSLTGQPLIRRNSIVLATDLGSEHYLHRDAAHTSRSPRYT